MAAAPMWQNECKRLLLSMFWTVWGVEFAVTRISEGERGKQKKLIASIGQFAQMSGKKSCSDFVKTFFSVLIAVLRIRRRQWTCGSSRSRSSLILAVLHTTGNDGELEDATAAGNDETGLPWTHKSHLPSTNDSTWVMLTGENPFGIPLVRRR